MGGKQMAAERGVRRVQLAVFAVLLTSLTLLLGAAGSSTALLGRALGSPSGVEVRGGAGASSALSTGGQRARLGGDRVGASVRGARQSADKLTPAVAHADQASPAGGAPLVVPARVTALVAVAGAVFALLVLLLAVPVVGRGRPAGRAPPLLSGV